MNTNLLIVSYNQDKIDEYKKYLSDLPLNIVSLFDLNIYEEAPEGAETFEENAIRKVKFYHQSTDLAAIGDDSVLIIDVLGGVTGVKSRYWLGYKMTDEEMIESVMNRMKDVPEDKRSCRLVAVIAFINKNGVIYTQKAE